MAVYMKPELSLNRYNLKEVCAATTTCDYYQCLVGGQTEYVGDVDVYTYTDSSGDTYYVWYSEYSSSGSESVNSSYITLLQAAAQSVNSTYDLGHSFSGAGDYANWHISTYYASSYYTS